MQLDSRFGRSSSITAETTIHEAAPALLRFLHAMVSSSPGPAGFEGSFAVCVRTRRGPVSLVARFGRSPKVEIVRGAPHEVELFWGMGEVEADALLGRRPMPRAPFVTLAGARNLLDAFSSRYLGTQSPLDLQLALGTGG